METQVRPLHTIATEIIKDWNKTNGNKGIYFGARPYLTAMLTLNTINDKYMFDSAKSIVLYFLCNASTWKGETARRIKKELNQLCK